tara:strand:- start:4554 stop:4859 length:306 start_codon:yes stop_codon:yes gene_type:complete
MLPDLRGLPVGSGGLPGGSDGLQSLLDDLTLLRSEQLADVKNDIMMTVLGHSAWFLAYRARLRMYREGGRPRPQYPSERVEAVETAVDSIIRLSIDPDYKR